MKKARAYGAEFILVKPEPDVSADVPPKQKDVSLLSDEVKWPHWWQHRNTSPKDMDDATLNCSIAIRLGWEHAPMSGPLNAQWRHRITGERASNESLPDYCNDLNAMHEAEKVALADEDTGYRYDMALCRIVNAYEMEGMCNHMRLFHAIARQRAEAFVTTMERV